MQHPWWTQTSCFYFWLFSEVTSTCGTLTCRPSCKKTSTNRYSSSLPWRQGWRVMTSLLTKAGCEFQKSHVSILCYENIYKSMMHIRVHLLPLKNEFFWFFLNPFFVRSKSHKQTAQKKSVLAISQLELNTFKSFAFYRYI